MVLRSWKHSRSDIFTMFLCWVLDTQITSKKPWQHKSSVVSWDPKTIWPAAEDKSETWRVWQWQRHSEVKRRSGRAAFKEGVAVTGERLERASGQIHISGCVYRCSTGGAWTDLQTEARTRNTHLCFLLTHTHPQALLNWTVHRVSEVLICCKHIIFNL